MNKTVKKMTFIALIAALYFVLCVIEGPLASGFMVNVRIAEGLLVLALLCPEVVFGCSLACFFYNLFFGFGIYDALIGTTATLIGGIFIVLISKLFKKDLLRLSLFGIGLVILNAILVPIVLIISLENVNWESYWISFGIVALGEALAVYVIGIPLYLSSKNVIIKYILENNN